MFSEVLEFLQKRLNSYFEMKTGHSREIVKFIDGTKELPGNIENDAVSPILMNLEEERTLRPADLYKGTVQGGVKTGSLPSIRLNLYILFVCKFADYKQSMRFLSFVVRFFQSHRLFNHKNSPDLHPDIDKLIMELITTPFSEQDNIWNALRSPHLPSVLYKVSLLVFREEDTLETATSVEKQKSNQYHTV